MTRVFSIANQKGGVGKTTTALNLSAALSSFGKRVLLIDLDPQANATMGSGVDKLSLDNSIYQVLVGISKPHEVMISTSSDYDILPANRELIGAEIELTDETRREFRLKDSIKNLLNNYDFIFIDCPPSLSLLTLNGLCASNGVIIPMQCEYFALEGLSDLINSIRRVHANLNTELNDIGLLRVMFDPRMTLSQQVSNQLLTHFGKKVFKTVIPRNVRLAEAPSHGLSIMSYDPTSRGSIAYSDFGRELLEKINN